MARRAVDPNQSFPALEQEVLQRWRDRDVFAESMRMREGRPEFVFYEGPPTANGKPGSHHVLARVFKDIFPRYKTMRGYHVARKGGWDTHGLPVEIQVEKALGLKSKTDIEAYGIEAFNQQCRESVFTYLEDWNALTERIGFWVDLDDAYRTLDPGYVESVWWALKQIWNKGLIYEGHKVVPYCPRCGTALASHEVAQGYKDVVDTSVYVKLAVAGDHGPLVAGDELVIWTTLPWTVLPNALVAVNPELTYARVRVEGQPAPLVVAEALVERVLGDAGRVEILGTFPGSALEGAAYAPAFPYIATADYGAGAHTVRGAAFVSAEDGTGLVGTAIAFGEDDYALGVGAGLAVINPVLPDGTFDERMGPYAGMDVRAADGRVVEELDAAGRLLRATPYEHSFPHCWRCSTPLVYYAKPSWYIETSRVREQLKASNEAIAWHPPHIKHGRMGDWLENNVDWALSRERYWGTPLPVWRCEDGHTHCIGSLEELEELSGVALEDPHRPYVDDVGFPCPQCAQRMQRVPEVIDVWFDSGAMPFAQHHAPFEAEERFKRMFPADFVCEALDQTRGWFYSLIAVGTLLFDRAPMEHVVCLGLILDENGEKMSKSKGNIVEPWGVIDRFGADAFRWYFFTSKQPWDGYRFSEEAVGEGVRLFLKQLWNTYAFLQTYEPSQDAGACEQSELDRWILSRLSGTVAEVTERLDDYDATFSGRAIAAFVDDLSNWYVRRNRRRFWTGDPHAFETLRTCLLTVSQLLAPFTPFVADELWEGLEGGGASVHLSDWPEAGERDEALLADMAIARDTVRMGLSARGASKIKLRQPLGEAVVVAAGAERAAIERFSEVIREELNVKALRFVAGAEELGSYALKANYRALGPRFGKAMPQVAAAIEALDAQHVAVVLRDGGTVGVNVEGREHELTGADVTLQMQPLDGYQVEREGAHAVALDLAIDDGLREEMLAREVVRAVQGARKDAGFDVSDRIALELGGDAALLGAARAHEGFIAGEVLAVSVAWDNARGSEVRIEGLELRISVTRV
ncbi:MAG: isoleucine-tRNA ligase [Solirubrobacterales bacterium]|jgi:isoleucyl-tRNA synthetase|nr:isoleucine-tRNA ligase [Solirubrobacterales bacterium]